MNNSGTYNEFLAFNLVGGALILLDGALNLPINMPMQVYAMAFQFISTNAIHLFLSILSITIGLVIITVTLLFVSLNRKESATMYLMFLSLGAISFLGGGGFVIGGILVVIANIWLVTDRITRRPAHSGPGRIRALASVASRSTYLTLPANERTVWNLINKEKGSILQSRLIVRSGFSKVNITRILNRLESKGLIERRRIGMSNVVLRK